MNPSGLLFSDHPSLAPHHQATGLAALPHEILTLIAYHVATDGPLTADLSSLLALMLTSLTLYNQLSATANPALYARIFQSKFDTSAAQRRFKYLSKADQDALRSPSSRVNSRLPSAVASPATTRRPLSPTSGHALLAPPEDQVEVTSTALCAELVSRYSTLRRLKRAVQVRSPALLTDADVWVVYLMLVENDERNIQHLISPSVGAPLLSYVRLYHEQDLVYEATQPGFPSTSLKRTLMIWIVWLLTTPGSLEAEGAEQVEEFLFVLRPYVFAVKQFDIFFGPWTLSQLPAAATTPAGQDDEEETFILGARARPQRLPMNPYMANLTPTSRAETINYYGRQIQLSPPILSHASILNFFARIDRSMGVARFGLMEGLPNPVMPGAQQVVLFRPRPSSRQIAYTSITESMAHDLDFQRLLQCSDASRSRGMTIRDWLGRFEGCWEGNFCFFDFDAFRSMLSGSAGSLYEGQFGEQAQVWRLSEIITRRRDPPRDASILNAGFAAGSSAFDAVIENGTLAHLGGSSSTAAAVVDFLERSSLTTKATTLLHGLDEADILSTEEVAAIKQGRSQEDVEMYIVGTGHSAFGEFVLRGRIRAWDGMVTMVKEYSPDGRGRWLYRGYIVGQDVLVGRWRDCVTPADYIGYEGTFTLGKRIEA